MMQSSPVRAAHPQVTPTSGLAWLPVATLLPVVEADPVAPDNAWLMTLARSVLGLVEHMMPVKVLPILTARKEQLS